MIHKQLRSEIAQRKLVISAEEPLKIDSSITRFIKAGGGELISC